MRVTGAAPRVSRRASGALPPTHPHTPQPMDHHPHPRRQPHLHPPRPSPLRRPRPGRGRLSLLRLALQEVLELRDPPGRLALYPPLLLRVPAQRADDNRVRSGSGRDRVGWAVVRVRSGDCCGVAADLSGAGGDGGIDTPAQDVSQSVRCRPVGHVHHLQRPPRGGRCPPRRFRPLLRPSLRRKAPRQGPRSHAAGTFDLAPAAHAATRLRTRFSTQPLVRSPPGPAPRRSTHQDQRVGPCSCAAASAIEPDSDG